MNLVFRGWCVRATILAIVVLQPGPLLAHTGPPFPIVTSRNVGAYEVSVWTDPDSTDDGSAAGRFWVTLRPSSGASLPADTRVNVAINPAGTPGQPNTASAEPVANDPSHRFAALVLDHEGRFHVRVTIVGPLGPAGVEADVDATYDLRPPPAMIAVYLIPFAGIGFLWLKLMLKRRRSGVHKSTARQQPGDVSR